ncbi:MAG: phosphoribosylformylglycinamidine cyclo-ligase [Phycisphaeraceae bacterium]|nr:phosphoribosylformylglycinamidine cyclo-ligase [Phycisphaeraceae bacterium]
MKPSRPSRRSAGRRAGLPKARRAADPAPDGLTYAGSGVDIEAGDEAVRRIKDHVQSTFGPRVLGKYGAFAGCFRLDYNERLFKRNYRDPVLVSCTDGVGTKVVLAARLGVYDTVGQDCVAMNVNDMIVQGAEPLFFLDYIGINKVIPQRIEQIVKGVADGCRLANCALLGGETAEMPDVYAEDDFDLAGFAVGVAELNRLIDGSEISTGDIVLGLASSGIHSNGYSLVRAIVEKAKLDYGKVYAELESDQPLGRVLLEPTRIYVRPVVNVLYRYRVKRPVLGMAHITGGGLPGNVNRCLPENVDARLSLKSWKIPPVFRFLQKKGGVSDEEMFRVFNMGIGYVLVVRPHFADSITDQLSRAGQEVIQLGRITEGTGKVVLA